MWWLPLFLLWPWLSHIAATLVDTGSSWNHDFEPPVKNNSKTSDKVTEAVRTAFSCRFPWNKKVSLLTITSNWSDAGSWVECLQNISRFQHMCIITVKHAFILVLLWFVSHWLNQYGTENFANTHVKDITLLSVVKKTIKCKYSDVLFVDCFDLIDLLLTVCCIQNYEPAFLLVIWWQIWFKLV